MALFTYTLRHGEHISLAQTLDCGQAFRFKAVNGGWEGMAGSRFIRAAETPDGFSLLCRCARECAHPGSCEQDLAHYFDLGRDYAALKQRFSADPVLARAVAYCPGIRVLRQDGWEALCSFILSQNNNIARIKGIISRLCESFGAPIDGGAYHTFPDAQTLASLTLEDLAPLRAGFRAKYLLDAARRVASGALALDTLYAMPLDSARAALTSLYGVGPKVADCVLLYGFGRMECFPRDVWIRRALAQLYPQGFPDAFSDVAGIAQQFLFHYCRTCPDALPAQEGQEEKAGV